MQLDNGMVIPHPLSHIGIVVKDADQTRKFLSSIIGVGPWMDMDYEAGKDELVAGVPFRMKVALTKFGPAIVELIQPIDSKGSIWSDFLETRGEGIQHVAFMVKNLDEEIPKMREQGCEPVAGAYIDGKRWCYFSTPQGGFNVELIEKALHHKSFGILA